MYIGKSVERVEDFRFLTGRGNYVDDRAVAGAAHAVYVRSPHAHADILNIATKAAAAMPGVLAVLTGADWEADGGGSAPVMWHVGVGDQPQNEVPRPILTAGRVRHVGDTIAMVVAETRYQALDAAEAIEVDYAPCPRMSSRDARSMQTRRSSTSASAPTWSSTSCTATKRRPTRRLSRPPISSIWR